MIAGITGHRPLKLGGYDEPMREILVETLAGLLVRDGATRGVTGMAIGADQYFAEACLSLRIPFTAAVPFEGQESRWPPAAQRNYHRLLALAASVVYVSPPGYALWKMQARNQWVVDHCDQLYAVWDGSTGGTANTVILANRAQRIVEVINPRELIHAQRNPQRSAERRQPALVATGSRTSLRRPGKGAGDA